MFACVSLLLITSGIIWILKNWLNIAFEYQFMVINAIINRRDISNKMHCQLLPKSIITV